MRRFSRWDSWDLSSRFWSKVDKDGECWIFGGGRDKDGYGIASGWSGQKNRANRFAWEDCFGEIPDGMLVLHRCDNPPCVNPAHLFLGTQADNVRDRDSKGRQRKGTTVTPEEVREIRRSGERQVDLAQRFGMSQANVSDIRRGRIYKWVRP